MTKFMKTFLINIGMVSTWFIVAVALNFFLAPTATALFFLVSLILVFIWLFTKIQTEIR
jgi:hypothetical protein